MRAYLILLFFPFFLFAYSEGEFYKEHPFTGDPLPEESSVDTKSQVFLYNGKGVWDTGYEHLKMFLTEQSISYKTIYAKDLIDNKSQWQQTQGQGHPVLILPGGESWQYLAELGEKGAARIKDFVQNGGGYIGICAGAFYATSNRVGGKATGPYGIGLLDGIAYDGTALKTPPFIEGMMTIPLWPGPFQAGFQSTYKISMFGGPSFRYSQKEAALKKIEVLATFQVINEPSMILFQYGKGKVYLSGPHLEIEENRTNWGPTFFDPETDWPLLKRALDRLSKDENGNTLLK